MENPFKTKWLFALAGALSLTSTALAHAQAGPLPLFAAAMGAVSNVSCASAPASGSPTKASAILGGQLSALEQMRQRQNGAPLAAPTVPAAGPDCQAFVASARPAAVQVGRGITGLNSEDFLASKRLPVRRTTFDAQWARVGHSAVPSGTVAEATRGAAGKLTLATLGTVNSYANQRIRYVDDRKLYGQADFWADAGTTLRRGAGDCEDYAIAKLALLAAAGVPRQDMFLTIARDLVRNADHAVLVVKLDGRFYLLDNNTDRLVDASESHDYRPIFSFNGERKFLHGYAA